MGGRRSVECVGGGVIYKQDIKNLSEIWRLKDAGVIQNWDAG